MCTSSQFLTSTISNEVAKKSSMVGTKGYGVGIIMVYQNLVVKLILDCVGQLQVGIGLEYQGVSKESITLIVIVWGKIPPIRHIMH